MKSRMRSSKFSDKLKRLKGSQCSWPGCQGEHFIVVSLPVMMKHGDGKFEQVKGVGLGVSFCQYHSFIIAQGGFVLVKSEKGYDLMGPVGPVELVESVVCSMIMSGRFDELVADKKLAESSRAELKKEVRSRCR